jgi:hypothetical protein
MFIIKPDNMKKLIYSLAFILITFVSFSQNKTQVISGTVLDKTTQLPIIGAYVYIKNSNPIIGSSTNEYGKYKIEKVPVGRCEVVCSFVGYSTYTSDAMIVNSAKEITLDIDLVEGLQIEGVTVNAFSNISQPVNSLAFLSARSFTAEETERIPTSVNDVSKMALSFAGVQKGRSDGENDIVVRGNSAYGMIWRLEGMDIPAPNHFAREGTSGGGISILSAQLMGRSDFYTGGMPAEFGNSMSAAFDIHLKNGNMDKYEKRAKFSLIGLDYAMEGPIKKGRSSFIFNGRYSTLGLMNRLGFYLVAENAWDEFGDFSFNLYFDNPEKNSKTNVFGMGGISYEEYMPFYPAEERDPAISWHFFDKKFGSNMGTVGIVHTKVYNAKTHLRLSAAINTNYNYRKYDSLSVSNEAFRYKHNEYRDNRLILSAVLDHSITDKLKIKTGLIGNVILYNFFMKNLPLSNISDISENSNQFLSVDEKGLTETAQAFLQASYELSPKLTITGGFHAIGLLMNTTGSIDPRFSIKYQENANNVTSLAIGKYSQMLPLPGYFYLQHDTLSNGTVYSYYPNMDLKFIYSNHYILSHQFTTTKKFKVSTELYYQDIHNGPVAADTSDIYYFLNNMSDFPAFDVNSTGRGFNYGVDLGIEKMFSNDFYFLLTGSLYQSKYYASNGKLYNTRFNGNYLFAFTLGKEFKIGSGVLQIGGRYTLNGGYRYSPYDPEKSAKARQYIVLAGSEMTAQNPAYWKIDGRIAYRFNRPKWAMNISVDVSNITGHKNVSDVGYNATTNEMYYEHHSGMDLIPLFSFQVDF